MTEGELKKWEEMAERATPGPWYAIEECGEACIINDYCDITELRLEPDTDTGWFIYIDPDDAALMAESRTAIPALIEEVQRLRGVLRTIRDIADRPGVVQLAKDALAEDKEVP